MIDLNSSNYKRIFCFGCSFTKYEYMPTWADILKLHFENTDTEVHNFGRAGAGNYYIFNTIVEESLGYKFTKDDLILVQWSGVLREDRFKDGKWFNPGNITTQDIYSTRVVKDWFLDVEGSVKRDYSYIHAIQKMLKADNLDYEMFSMNGLMPFSQYIPKEDMYDTDAFDFEYLYEDTMTKLHSSMYEITWGTDDEPEGIAPHRTLTISDGKKIIDAHPLPTEHLLYLEKVFQFKPSDELRTHVDNITKELLNDNT